MKESPKEYQINSGPEEDEDIILPEVLDDVLPDYVTPVCGKEPEQ